MWGLGCTGFRVQGKGFTASRGLGMNAGFLVFSARNAIKHKREFPKISGTLFGGPYNKDPII